MLPIRSLGRAALLVALMATPAFCQEAFQWETSLEAAKQRAAATNRLVLIHLSAPWCKPCQHLEQTVFSRPDFGAPLTKDFVGVKLNADHYPSVAKMYGVKTIPADVVVTPSGQLVQMMNSPATLEQYQMLMTQVAASARASGMMVARSQPATPSPNIPVAGIAPVSGPNSAAPAFRPAAGAPPAMAATMPVPPPAPSVPLSSGPQGAAMQDTFAQSTPQNPAMQTGQAPANDRYSDYFSRRTGQAPAASAPPIEPRVASLPPRPQVNGPAPQAPTLPPMQSAPIGMAPQNQLPSMQTPSQFAGAPVHAPMYAPAPTLPSNVPAAAPPRNAVAQGPAGAPPPVAAAGMASVAAAPVPVALEGYCPITLAEKKTWVKGDPRYGVIHQGRLYLFAGPEEKQKFWAAPDTFSPVLSGADPVAAKESGQSVEGYRKHGVFYSGRIYLFHDENTLARFAADPNKYLVR